MPRIDIIYTLLFHYSNM